MFIACGNNNCGILRAEDKKPVLADWNNNALSEF